jgi:hypothetical protein
MQYIIDAPPRTGKSQYAIYLIDKFSKKFPNRHIVTNIIGINYPGVISVNGTLHNPVDWRDYPNGTIFIYDEAHEHPAFSKDDLMKDMIVDTSELDSIMSKISNGIFDNQVNYFLDLHFENNNFDAEHITEIKNTIKNQKRLPIDFKKQIFDDINKKKKLALVKKKEDILDIGRSLTLHGHFGFDIYLITQDVKRLNEATIAASSKHLKLRRLFGWPVCLIYEYAEVQKYFAASTRNNAISIRPFFYRPYLYKYYISSEEHNVQKTYPTWIIFLILLVFGLGYLGYSKLKSGNALGLFGEEKSVETKTANEPYKPDTSTQAGQVELDRKIIECVNSFGWTPDQCKQAYDHNAEQQRTKDLEQSTRNSMENVVFDYDPNKPYDAKFTANFQPTTFPQFKNAVVWNGKCTAYSQQGTIMHDVSQKDCYRLANGDRPFDYFKQENQITAPQSVQASLVPETTNQKTYTAEELAKFQQAKQEGLI